MHSSKLGKPTTQYDQLLFIAARNFIQAAGEERKDLSGEYNALDATAAAVLWDDPKYEEDVERIFRDEDGERQLTRSMMYEHYAVIMRHLRVHGHLDHAPTPVDEGAADFLGE